MKLALLKIQILLLCLSPIFTEAQGNTFYPESTTKEIRVATFDIDATPPVGTRLMYNIEVQKWDLGLRAKGLVLLGAGKPIVLCSVDWIGIANEGYNTFRREIADAAGTIPERVALHTVHQHDAPICDFSSEQILKEAGLDPLNYEGSFAREVIQRLKVSIKISLANVQKVTHIGLGEAPVYRVASNRRILGDDNLVKEIRFTSCKDSLLRAEPEGLIDPLVSLISFWNENEPLAVLSYYATHPQSYYRTGVANPDFPGIARFFRQMAVPNALHIHFNGAAGDIGAGKYNDGSVENRLKLAERLADGMKRAWETTTLTEIKPKSIKWRFKPVELPASNNLEYDDEWLKSADQKIIVEHFSKMAWFKRLQAGKKIDISCLCIGNARILHLPGEPFIQYQLSAKNERPDLFVVMAAYGDYGPGYIGTSDSYKQGGFETSGYASGVTFEAEEVIMKAVINLLR